MHSFKFSFYKVWKDCTCFKWADGCLVVPGTLGMKVAAPLHVLCAVALGETDLSENSISQQSGGSWPLMAWKSSFQFWEGGVAVSVRYSLLKNCHITNRTSVDTGAYSETQTEKNTRCISYLLRNSDLPWFWLWSGCQEEKKYKTEINQQFQK